MLLLTGKFLALTSFDDKKTIADIFVVEGLTLLGWPAIRLLSVLQTI